MQITFLANKDNFRYLKTADYQVLELPYAGELFSMIIILPNQHFGLNSMIHSIDVFQIMNQLSQVSKESGSVLIPKFNNESSFKLSDCLKNMGIVDAFNPNKADFNSISPMPLYVSSVIHKASIEVGFHW